MNNLLDQLDGQVENRLHQQDKDVDNDDTDDSNDGSESQDVQYILETSAHDSDDDDFVVGDNSGEAMSNEVEVEDEEDLGGGDDDEGQEEVLDFQHGISTAVVDDNEGSEAQQQAVVTNADHNNIEGDKNEVGDEEEIVVVDPPRAIAADVDASFFSVTSQEQIIEDVVMGDDNTTAKDIRATNEGNKTPKEVQEVSSENIVGEHEPDEEMPLPEDASSSLKDGTPDFGIIDASKEIDERDLELNEATEKHVLPTTNVEADDGKAMPTVKSAADSIIQAPDSPSTVDAAELTAKAIASATAKHKQIVAALQKTHKAELTAEAAKQKQVTVALEKQIRKLNRTIKQMSNDLDLAQKEIDAQQKELYQAADRIDDDKARYSEKISNLESMHKDAMAMSAREHELAMSGLKASHQIQIDELRNDLKQAEEDRTNEAGDWESELEIALQREQEGLKKVVLLEEENATLTSQISSLQTQLDAAHSRITSSTTTASAASEREREAFEKLDAALSVHARQIAQRQAREAELERKVGELSTALVEVQTREKLESGIQDIAGQTSSEDGNLSAKTLKEEIESLATILAQERQHNSMLKKEVQTMSEERSKEDASAVAKQRMYDREAAELAMTISKLESTVRDKDAIINELNVTKKDTGHSNSGNTELQSRVESLSEQVLRQQARIESSSSEKTALRQRLRVALSRAENAEKALIDMSNSSDVDSGFESVEEGLTRSRNSIMRRRRNQGNGGSIRSAISFNGRGDARKEKIAKAIDIVDKFSVEAGIYFRYNPLARAGFVLYFILLHLWTFSLIVFHVHSTEPVHGDFGQGIGPGSLPGIQNSLRESASANGN